MLRDTEEGRERPAQVPEEAEIFLEAFRELRAPRCSEGCGVRQLCHTRGWTRALLIPGPQVCGC